MPIVYNDHNSNGSFCIGVWEVIESESFFLDRLSLSNSDLSILEKAKNNTRRIEILSVRLLLKSLGLNTDLNYTQTGKPTISSGNISISHTNRYSAVVYHRNKTVSVDIERISEILLKAKHLIFNAAEIEFVNNDIEQLTTLWCCKECVVKMTDNLKINFLTQINVHPFIENEIIECEYAENERIKRFHFHYYNFDDHICVWGVDD